MGDNFYDIGVIPGDGTGPEVVAEAIKALDATEVDCSTEEYDIGGDRYLKTGEILPDSVKDELSQHDALLLGAIGHPDVKPGILEKGILLTLRFDFDQYINLRPVKLFENVETPLADKSPEDVDFVVVRENTGGIYTGIGGVARPNTSHEIAVQSMVYDRDQVDRCLRFAFEYTQKRDKDKTLALCGKTNVLTNVYDLWERAFHKMGEEEFPDIKRDYYHVDATCMWMVKNPEWFDVIVTGNMFGDIITDLGAMIQGGMGIAAGGNINPEEGGTSMFEPIGGSAPKYTGKGAINPLASIYSAGMMLDHLGETDAAQKIEDAVKDTCTKMDSMGAGKMGYSTSEVGDMVAQYVADH